MVDREMLSAISDLLDEKLEQKLDQKLEEKLDQKLEEKLDQKLDQRLQPLCERLDRVEQGVKGMGQDIKAVKKNVKAVEQNVRALEQNIRTVEKDVHYIKVVQLENNVMPRLSTMESCYLDTFQRYKESTQRIDSMADDIEILKLTVSEHSDKLARISV